LKFSRGNQAAIITTVKRETSYLTRILFGWTWRVPSVRMKSSEFLIWRGELPRRGPCKTSNIFNESVCENPNSVNYGPERDPCPVDIRKPIQSGLPRPMWSQSFGDTFRK